MLFKLRELRFCLPIVSVTKCHQGLQALDDPFVLWDIHAQFIYLQIAQFVSVTKYHQGLQVLDDPLVLWTIHAQFIYLQIVQLACHWIMEIYEVILLISVGKMKHHFKFDTYYRNTQMNELLNRQAGVSHCFTSFYEIFHLRFFQLFTVQLALGLGSNIFFVLQCLNRSMCCFCCLGSLTR